MLCNFFLSFFFNALICVKPVFDKHINGITISYRDCKNKKRELNEEAVF